MPTIGPCSASPKYIEPVPEATLNRPTSYPEAVLGVKRPGGLSDGQRAYLLDASALVVPEPAALAPLAAGGLALVGRGRRRSVDRLQTDDQR